MARLPYVDPATASARVRETLERVPAPLRIFFMMAHAEANLRPLLRLGASILSFLEDPRLPIHNNISELNLRRQAVGRKAWLFVGSEDGARGNTVFVSLLASCAMHRIEPWAYLRDLLWLLPRWSALKVLELAPANWLATIERPDVQATLSANIYRAATLVDIARAVA